jgi:hypothetical protein
MAWAGRVLRAGRRPSRAGQGGRPQPVGSPVMGDSPFGRELLAPYGLTGACGASSRIGICFGIP